MTPLERLIKRFQVYLIRRSTELIREGVNPEGLVTSPQAVTKWYQDVQREIVRYHTASAMLGSGVSELTPQVLSILKNTLPIELSYFNGFYIKVQSDREFNRREAARAASYANGIKVPYWKGRTQQLPLPAMPAQGTLCHGNCGCSWRIDVLDEEAGDYDCYWERSKDDSCGTCLTREEMWNPYRIRGGEVQ